MAEEAPTPTVMLVAGEASGDLLGARLMRALCRRTGGRVAFIGIGGPLMTAEGLESIAPMEDLSVMGLVEVLPRLARIRRHLKAAEALARARRPRVLVTIDSPGFNKRLAARLKGTGIVLVHYVAPTVWAWRPGRAAKMAAIFDRLLALFPFEPPYFTAEGLPCDFVGHPAVEEMPATDAPAAFRRFAGIGAEERILLLLPGSRNGEVARHLPLFAEAAGRFLQGAEGRWRVVVPTLPWLKEQVAARLAKTPLHQALVLADERPKAEILAAGDLALAASGTVTLELALAATPAIVAYRVNALTAAIARRLITTPYVALLNVLMKDAVVPELLQQDCRPDRLAGALDMLARSETARQGQIAAGKAAAAMLAPAGQKPSEAAALAVLDAAGLL